MTKQQKNIETWSFSSNFDGCWRASGGNKMSSKNPRLT